MMMDVVDVVGFRGDVRSSGGAGLAMTWLTEEEVVDTWGGGGGGGGGGVGQEEEEEEEKGLVEVVLEGRSPWGFTLRGGREHREPLLITKVEAGSVAAGVRLLAGDEMVRVNGVPLGGWKNEAISLVKSTHKTLSLVVRRNRKPCVTPPPRPKEFPGHAHPVTGHAHPVPGAAADVAMERLERPAPHHHHQHHHHHTYQSGSSPEPLAAAGSTSTTGGSSSGFSCFSSSSSPPVPDAAAAAAPPPTRKLGGTAASTENVFFKGLLSEMGGPQNRHQQHQQHPRYLQPPLGSRGWERERERERERPWAPVQDDSSASPRVVGRTGVGPVWQVPPPPPPPPLRSDSFAATKVFPYSEGPYGTAHRRSHGKGLEVPPPLQGEGGGGSNHHHRALKLQQHHHPLPASTHVLEVLARRETTKHQNHLHPGGKLFSLSSNDVRQGQGQSYSAYHQHHHLAPHHPRQHSDESPFYLQSRALAAEAQQQAQLQAQKQQPQSVASYYRSLQDIPGDTDPRKPVRLSAAFAPVSHLAPGTGNNNNSKARPGIRDGAVEMDPPGSVCSPLKSVAKAKPALPQSQLPYADNSLAPMGNSLGPHQNQHQHLVPEPSSSSSSLKSSQMMKMKGGSWQNGLVNRQQPLSEQGGLASGPRPQDPWVPQKDRRISRSKTPLLHSLAQESRRLVVPRQLTVVATGDTPSSSTQVTHPGGSRSDAVTRQPVAAAAAAAAVGNNTGDAASAAAAAPPPQALDPAPSAHNPVPAVLGPAPAGEDAGEACRRGGDRYATTLRHRILQKRAQLQKSRSAVTLTHREEEEDEEEEEPEGWRSMEETTSSASCSSAFSNTYKDHLKEAQARVLQATSFQRRDLEPVGGPAGKANGGNNHGAPQLLSRIGGRKRFPLAQRVHSFSEPDKIDKVGTTESGRVGIESFGQQQQRRRREKLLDSRPAFSKPVLKPALPIFLSEARPPPPPPPQEGVGRPGQQQASPERQQRLGTFAEYQATWSWGRRPAAAAAAEGVVAKGGRYRSAENILDPGAEKVASSGAAGVCVHERSRSSPSADFYAAVSPGRELL
ncbi:hypothetical protein CRUP_002237 [Coryphaenoides rupestris]|nr:hypothetical protein CRUP_002237 [Coryphaenoides rupestris]